VTEIITAILSVFYNKKHAALKAAEIEKEYRGHKYICEVLESTLNEGVEGAFETKFKVILPLD
jgi:hypothetical protein